MKMPKPVAWADDAVLQGRVGNVCSESAKRYWEKSDWVDRKNAEVHKHPLYDKQALIDLLEGAAALFPQPHMEYFGREIQDEILKLKEQL